MTFSEAQAELTILRGLAESGNDLALVKERIARLYLAVCNKTLKKCNCKDKYRDALYEIYYTLRYYENNMEEFNTTAKLVNGVVLFVDGKHYSNNNLTDEVARNFLAKFPQRKNWFSVLPNEPEKEQAKAESAKMPENGAEIVSKGIKAQSQAITPKKKTKGAKRK